MITRNRIWATGLATAAALALALGGGAVAANAAQSESSSTSCTFAQHLQAAWKTVPVDLQSDLKSLKAMEPGAERRAAAKKIRATAVDGGYGPGVEAKAQWRQDHPGVRLRPLPDALKADLTAMKGETKAEKAKALDQIAAKALDGTYGVRVETFATAVQSSDAWQSCGS